MSCWVEGSCRRAIRASCHASRTASTPSCRVQACGRSTSPPCSAPPTWGLTRSVPGREHMRRCTQLSHTTGWPPRPRSADVARIVLDGVTKVFGGEVVAVDHVSMEIADGEFMVLVGPSGCGKSTLLRIVAGLEELTDGEVVIGDRIVTDLAPRDRDIAMVFQNYALYPHMSVEQNLGLGLKLRHIPKAGRRQQVDEVARVLGLDQLLDRKPAQLSGGQRQRVAMGRAMVREPRAFLMDEPLSNLDAKLRVQMRAELARLRDSLHTTTINVTPDEV